MLSTLRILKWLSSLFWSFFIIIALLRLWWNQKGETLRMMRQGGDKFWPIKYYRHCILLSIDQSNAIGMLLSIAHPSECFTMTINVLSRVTSQYIIAFIFPIKKHSNVSRSVDSVRPPRVFTWVGELRAPEIIGGEYSEVDRF